MHHLLEDVHAAKAVADGGISEYKRQSAAGADDHALIAVLERLHAAAEKWADAEEKAGTITDIEVVAGERIAKDRAGHWHGIGLVNEPPALGARAEGCRLMLPDADDVLIRVHAEGGKRSRIGGASDMGATE